MIHLVPIPLVLDEISSSSSIGALWRTNGEVFLASTPMKFSSVTGTAEMEQLIGSSV